MVNIGDFAKAYEPQKMKNIADLDIVKTDVEIKSEVRKDKANEDYSVSFILIEGEEYRVPISVIESLKTILEVKPELKTFKVQKTGEGMATKYTVVALD